MKEVITSYVGLDIHKDTVAIAVAETGRAAPRFIGTINPFPAELCKALRRQHCTPGNSLLVYEAGPCGYGWARYLRKQGWKCEVISQPADTREIHRRRHPSARRVTHSVSRLNFSQHYRARTSNKSAPDKRSRTY